jgi:hypothetical protein
VELWLVGLLAASIGLPFIALSAGAPLLQNWFALSGHAHARNPYVLYAASNLGSFAALILYPFALEPLLSLHQQSRLWTTGYGLLVIPIVIAGFVAARGSPDYRGDASRVSARPTWRERARWTVLAAVPAGLVIAVTVHITTDIAAAPFLWVIPLALYLLTFVAVFRERPWIAHANVVFLIPFALAPFAILVLGGNKAYWLMMAGLNLLCFFLLTMLCHGALYARRPGAERLTEFYLWMSFGGVLGGIFSGLLAPHLFNGTTEYPILIVAALLALPGAWSGGVRAFARDAGPVLAIAMFIVAVELLFDASVPTGAQVATEVALVVLLALMLWQRRKPARFVALVVLAFVISEPLLPGVKKLEQVRSFFGVHRVIESTDGDYHLLFHGTTIHGIERVRQDGSPVVGRPEPLSYYYFGGPIADGIAAARLANQGFADVAAVGLGAGALACHRRSGENWTFFEIDPEVVRIARDGRAFRFLSECGPDIPIVLGDARLTLASARARYDLIILDAFSSDAIPVHLLTREAFAAYLGRLKPHGAILAHISNRHLELAHVVAAIGAAEGLVAYTRLGRRSDFSSTFKASSEVVMLARSIDDLGDLPTRAGWHRIVPDPVVTAWTDDYANVPGAIWRRYFGE